MKKAGKKVVKLILLLFLVGCIVIAAINCYVCHVASAFIVTLEMAAELTDIDCILVLGCSVKADQTPSLMLNDRVQMGIDLYRNGVSRKLLMSGDHGSDDYNEVQVMKNLALEAGVPEEDIFMDHAGFSTYESIYRARDVFQAEKVLIVSQDYHLYRAIYTAKKLGLTAYGVAADGQSYSGQWMRELREAAARIKDCIFIIADVKPEYLGEVIPVSGDGRITAD